MGGVTRALVSRRHQRYRAAMEPAADGRGDISALLIDHRSRYRPQWSPPLMGGVTSAPKCPARESSDRRNGARR